MMKPSPITVRDCGPIIVPVGYGRSEQYRGIVHNVPPRPVPEVWTEPLETRLAGAVANLSLDASPKSTALYHRGYTTAPRTVVGLGLDFYAIPLEQTTGEWTLEAIDRGVHPLYILDDSPEAVLRVTDRVADQVRTSFPEGATPSILFSVVDDRTKKIVRELSARYVRVPQFYFVGASVVSDDLLDAGLSQLPSANTRTAMANLANFFEKLGKYKPTGPDLDYTLGRDAFCWWDE